MVSENSVHGGMISKQKLHSAKAGGAKLFTSQQPRSRGLKIHRARGERSDIVPKIMPFMTIPCKQALLLKFSYFTITFSSYDLINGTNHQ